MQNCARSNVANWQCDSCRSLPFCARGCAVRCRSVPFCDTGLPPLSWPRYFFFVSEGGRKQLRARSLPRGWWYKKCGGPGMILAVLAELPSNPPRYHECLYSPRSKWTHFISPRSAAEGGRHAEYNVPPPL